MDQKSQAEWARKIGLDDAASMEEISAREEELKAEDPTLFKRLTSSWGDSMRSSMKTMGKEQRDATQRDREKAGAWAGMFGASDETIADIASPIKYDTSYESGPKNSVMMGGDTYTKSPEDWTKELSPARPLEEDSEEDDIASQVEQRIAGMKMPDKPTLKDTSAIDATVGSWFEKAQASLASGNVPDGEEDEFAQELAQLRSDYKAERDWAAKREILHDLVDAVTKFGAGYASAKTGHNYNNVQTKQHDFQKDRALLEDERKTDLADLRSRRQEDIQKRKEAADMGFKQSSLELDKARAEQNRIHQENSQSISLYNAQVDAAYKSAMVGIYGQRDESKTETMWSKWQADKDKAAEAYRTRGDQAGDEIKATLVRKDIEPEDKAALIQSTLTNKLEIPPERAKEIVATTNWIGMDSIKDTPSIMASVDNIAANEYRIRKLTGTLMPGEILVMNEQTGLMSAAKNPKAVPAGYKVVATAPRMPQ